MTGGIPFIEKCNVYGYSMMCYEITIGYYPFEVEGLFSSINIWTIVINGLRLKLPLDLHPMIKDAITSIWHRDPFLRPYFHDIIKKYLRKIYV